MNAQQRLRVVGGFVLLLLVALTGRLGVLQTVESASAKRQAQSNIYQTVLIPPTRGRILDAKGRRFVDNLALNVVRIEPKKLAKKDRVRTLSRLAALLNVPYYKLEQRLNDPSGGEFSPREVARGPKDGVTESVAIALAENAELYPATSVGTVWQRVYPHGAVAAHVLGYIGKITEEELARQPVTLGYVGSDLIGKAGVERSFEKELRGIPGQERITKDRLGRVVERETVKEAEPGKDVRLSIDLDTQILTEESLEQTILAARRNVDADITSNYIRATSGAAVVMDPRTGQVIAMASYPTYDPREFVPNITQQRFDELFKGDDKFSPLTNRASFGLYPPGSTFKPFSALAGLRAGLITPISTINDQGEFVRPDICKLPGNVRCRWQNAGKAIHGPTDLRRALAVSSDVYFYTIGSKFADLGRSKENGVQLLAREMGLGRPTKIRLPDERAGAVPDEAYRQAQTAKYGRKKFPNNNWFFGDNINVSIGQGEVLTSPVGLARAYAALVNGGTVVDAKIELEILDRTIGPAVTQPPKISADLPVETSLDATTTAATTQPTTTLRPAGPLAPVTALTTTSTSSPLPDGAADTAGGEDATSAALGFPSAPTLPPATLEPTVQNHLDLGEQEITTITSGLTDVVTAQGGTARAAFLNFPFDRCPVAGKTGTAQVRSGAQIKQGKGKQDTSVFVGFGPVKEPKYVVVMIVEQGGFGRQAAGGVRRIFEGLCGLPTNVVATVSGTSRER
jgi:penicillin-binding protein 2